MNMSAVDRGQPLNLVPFVLSSMCAKCTLCVSQSAVLTWYPHMLHRLQQRRRILTIKVRIISCRFPAKDLYAASDSFHGHAVSISSPNRAAIASSIDSGVRRWLRDVCLSPITLLFASSCNSHARSRCTTTASAPMPTSSSAAAVAGWLELLLLVTLSVVTGLAIAHSAFSVPHLPSC
jgi:hypothetical protein